jgi:hypothetical protein
MPAASISKQVDKLNTPNISARDPVIKLKKVTLDKNLDRIANFYVMFALFQGKAF